MNALVVWPVGLVVLVLVAAPLLAREFNELLFAIILPGLIFEAAFHVEFRKFWKNKLAIHALAIPGVVASVAITAEAAASSSSTRRR